jgi:hypothetical protein
LLGQSIAAQQVVGALIVVGAVMALGMRKRPAIERLGPARPVAPK